MSKIAVLIAILTFFYGNVHAQLSTIVVDNISYKQVSVFEDGKPMADSAVDGVIYKKSKGKYYKRIYDGAIKTSWFGAAGNGRTDDS